MFSKRLLKFIELQRLSIGAFERECSVTQGVISKSIQNKTVLSGTNLIKIANRYPECSIDWLLTGEDSMIKGDNKKLELLLKNTKEEVAYWKDLTDTLKLAVKEKYKSENQSDNNRFFTEDEAIKLLSSCKSKGSDIQKASFRIYDMYLGICKLYKRGLREPAVLLSKKLVKTAVYYQEYNIAAELAKYLVNHAAQFDSRITSKKYLDLYEEYSSMSDLEFKARQVFNQVYYNHEHHIDTDREEIDKALLDIQKVMKLDSIAYRAYYYQCKCLLSTGEDYLNWINEAISYFEGEYFRHDAYISHFKFKLIQNYINLNDLVTAFNLFEEAISESAEGSYAWLKYMFSYIELLAKQRRLKEAGENFEIATNHEIFASLAEDDRRYWEVLREMIYDSENVSYSMKS